MSQSVKIAGAILALVLLYFGVRAVFGGENEQQAEAVPEEFFTVIVQQVSPQEWRDEIVVRGRTEAIRKIVVRAETSGVVAETPATLGAQVEGGDVLCRIKVDARQAQFAEANAAFSKAKLDYDAAKRLFEEGFRSETGVAAAKAALDQAAANVERAKVELQKAVITAPFSGVFDERNVEVGDFVNVGEPCGVVIQRTPFLVTGAVSEKDIAKISKGDRGVATLATGETVEGILRLVSRSADPQTRTFDIELEIPNEDGSIRDGVTAQFTVFAAQQLAYLVPSSALSLNDSGEIGVRSVNGDNRVVFSTVQLLGETSEGVLVRGLEGDAQVIVRGQEFVKAGQRVLTATPESAGL